MLPVLLSQTIEETSKAADIYQTLDGQWKAGIHIIHPMAIHVIFGTACMYNVYTRHYCDKYNYNIIITIRQLL